MEEEELTSSTRATNSTHADSDSFMEHILPSHNIPLFLICGASLFIGLYLAVNKFWHLQVAKLHFKPKDTSINYLTCNQVSTEARGRGTIKLIAIHHWLDMGWIPIIAAQMGILATPATVMPTVACILLQVGFGILWFNSYQRGLVIAFSR